MIYKKCVEMTVMNGPMKLCNAISSMNPNLDSTPFVDVVQAVYGHC